MRDLNVQSCEKERHGGKYYLSIVYIAIASARHADVTELK